MGMQYPEAGSRSSRDAAKEKALGSIPCAASAFPYPVPQYGFQRQHISEYQHRQMYQYPPRLLQDHQHPDDHQLRQRQEKTLSPRQDSHASTSTSRSIGSSSAFKLPPYTVATVRLYNLLRRRTKDRVRTRHSSPPSPPKQEVFYRLCFLCLLPSTSLHLSFHLCRPSCFPGTSATVLSMLPNQSGADPAVSTLMRVWHSQLRHGLFLSSMSVQAWSCTGSIS